VNVTEGIWIALGALRANKLRTFLTLLGNIVGVTSVIAVVSIVDGMNRYVREELAQEGSNVITLRRVDEFQILTSLEKFLESLHNPRLGMDDVSYLKEEGRVPSAEFIGASAGTTARVQFGKKYVDDASVRGRSASYYLISDYELESGRHFTELEDYKSRPVTIIGWDLKDKLFGRDDPVGKRIKIAGKHLTVLGVAKKKPGVLGGNPNIFALIPVSTYQKMFGSRESISIPIKVASIDEMGEAIDEVTAAMRLRHRLKPGAKDDFVVTTSERILSLWENVSKSIFRGLIFIASIALVVAGVVIMNMMLVSVTERTREVGIRKALGARRADIVWQFLVEAVTLSSVGGIIGIGVGFALASIVSLISPLPYAIEIWSVVAGFLVTVAVGIFFGLYPAYKAALLDPVEALRYE
jgi:putative ABC transport system permease protein